VYRVHGGSVSAPTFSSSSLVVNSATQVPFVFLGTSSQQFSMQFSYSAGAVLRAVTEARVVTGVATSIGVTGPAYTDDMGQLWIVRAPVPGFQVELVFTALSTEPDFDFVTVYNGVSGNLSSVLRVSGAPSTLPNITSTSEGMAVMFASDDLLSNAQGYLGFAADFSFVRRVNQAGSISCTGACYAGNVQYKW
jgi:hypothetical protein